MFFNTKDGISSPQSQFQKVPLNAIPLVVGFLQPNFFLYEMDIVHEKVIGVFAQRIVKRNGSNVRLLGYNIDTCYVSNINGLF